MPLKNDIQVLIGGDIKGLTKALDNADKYASKSAKSITSTFMGIGTALAGGIGGGAILKEAVVGFASLEDNLLVAGAAAKLTTDQIDDLQQKTLELGGEPAQSPMQVALGFKEAARAGQDFDEMMTSIGPNAQLAAASELELGESVEKTTDILAAFGKTAGDTQELVDVLIAGANSASITVTQMADSYKYAGSIAESLGQSINKTSAELLILANSGIKGEQGGTALRGVMASLIEKSDVLASKYGVMVEEVRNGQVVMRDFDKIIDDLGNTGLTAADRFKIFGRESGPAISAFLKQGGQAIRDYEEDLNNAAGTGERVGKTMQSGIGGSLRTISSDLQTATVMIGQEFAPALELISEYSYLAARGVNFLTGTANLLGAGFTEGIAIALNQLSTLAKATDFTGITDGLSAELSDYAQLASGAADELNKKTEESFEKMLNGSTAVKDANVKNVESLQKIGTTTDEIANTERLRSNTTVDGITAITNAEKALAEERSKNNAEMFKTLGVGSEAYYQAEAQKILDQGAKWQELGASVIETEQYMYEKINALSTEAWAGEHQLAAQYLDGLTAGFTSAVDDISADINTINGQSISVPANMDTGEFTAAANDVIIEADNIDNLSPVVSINADNTGALTAFTEVENKAKETESLLSSAMSDVAGRVALTPEDIVAPFSGVLGDKSVYYAAIDAQNRGKEEFHFRGKDYKVSDFYNFANGGIMTNAGAIPLHKYANGGIATKPQVALYGEGSKPEAYVPLPDGRTIPVTLKGKSDAGTTEQHNTYNITINVQQAVTGQDIERMIQDIKTQNKRTIR